MAGVLLWCQMSQRTSDLVVRQNALVLEAIDDCSKQVPLVTGLAQAVHKRSNFYKTLGRNPPRRGRDLGIASSTPAVIHDRTVWADKSSTRAAIEINTPGISVSLRSLASASLWCTY